MAATVINGACHVRWRAASPGHAEDTAGPTCPPSRGGVMSTPVRSTKPCTQFAAKRDSGVGLRTARCQPAGCLRLCGLGGIRPAHPWDRVLARPEHLVGPQGTAGVIKLIQLHQQLHVLTERDAQRVGGSVRPGSRALGHAGLHSDEWRRRSSARTSGSSCRHRHTLPQEWNLLPHLVRRVEPRVLHLRDS